MATKKIATTRDSLECPVCFEFFVPPVYQCHNGHLICKDCINGMEACPICRKPLPAEKIRNLVMEKIIVEQVFPCDYKSFGCEAQLEAISLKEHIENCNYAPVQICKDLGLQCDKAVCVPRFVDHLVSWHDSLGSLAGASEVNQSFEGQAQDPFSLRVVEWEPHYFITEDDSTFCLLLQTKLVARKMHWRVFAVMYDKANAAPPVVKVTLLTEQSKSSSEYPVPRISWKGQATTVGQRATLDLPPCFILAEEQLQGLSSWRIRVKLCSRPGRINGDITTVSNWILSGDNRIHSKISCDGCEIYPLKGIRFKCAVCDDFDLCESCCLDKGIHRHHSFIVIQTNEMSNKVDKALEHRQEEEVGSYNDGAFCNGCDNSTTKGLHFHCTECYSYDLCSHCYLDNKIHGHHMFVLAPSEGDIHGQLEKIADRFWVNGLSEELRK